MAITAPDSGTHRAYKLRLDPNQQQLRALYQAAGAARYTYNLLTAHNLEVKRHRDEYWHRRHNDGAEDTQIKAELKELTAANPQYYRQLGFAAYSSQYLTARKHRHRDAACRIAAGEDPTLIWDREVERSESPWLHTMNQRVLVSGLQSADKAWKNFWDSRTGARAGRLMGTPRFKKKGADRDSFTVPAPEAMGVYGTAYLRGEPAYQQGKRTITDYRHVRLSYLGVIRTYDSTKPLAKAVAAGAKIRSYTVSRSADRWYVSLLVELSKPLRRTPTKRQRAAGAVGIDLGVNALASLSDGTQIPNPRFTRAASARLHKLQRALARSQRGSNRRARIIRQVARLHHMTALRREGSLHQLTKRLVTGYTLIGIEDLNVVGMIASARGTLENPGRNVAQKSGLNRSILDASFGALRRQLEYKAAWYGATITDIDRYYPSSQICSACGQRAKTKLSLRVRVFECLSCGMRMDRDVNAARNIRARAVVDSAESMILASESGESLNGREDAAARRGGGVVEASRPAASYCSGSPQTSNRLPVYT